MEAVGYSMPPALRTGLARVFLLIVGVALTGPSARHLAAQDPGMPRLPSMGSMLPPAYKDPALSTRLLAALADADPGRLEWHLALAREATTLGLTAETQEARKEALNRAIGAGRAAVALEPESAEARYWLAAGLGLLADEEGGRAKISNAREAYQEALRSLELDADHGGAHHIVGRLHAGARRLSWLSRMIARGLGLGEIIDEASWESAEEHMRMAVAEDPDPLVHHFELGKLLVETGRDPEEGRAILEELAARTPRYPLDAHYIRRAEAFLASVPGPEGSGPF